MRKFLVSALGMPMLRRPVSQRRAPPRCTTRQPRSAQQPIAANKATALQASGALSCQTMAGSPQYRTTAASNCGCSTGTAGPSTLCPRGAATQSCPRGMVPPLTACTGTRRAQSSTNGAQHFCACALASATGRVAVHGLEVSWLCCLVPCTKCHRNTRCAVQKYHAYLAYCPCATSATHSYKPFSCLPACRSSGAGKPG